jgi:parallel beta-helix repeat protein
MTISLSLRHAVIGSILVPAAPAWAQTPPGTLAAASQGVVCDGHTDATSALQGAMAAAAQAHATLLLPQGVCMVDKLVWPAGLSGLKGQGPDATVIRRTADSQAQVLLDIEGAGGFTVADLTLDGNKAANSVPNHDVLLNNNWGFTFERVHAIGARGAGRAYGFGFFQVADANQAHNTQTRFVDCVGATNDNSGIGGQEASNLTISGGTWRDNGGSGIDFYKAWVPGAIFISGLTITHTTASGNGRVGIEVSSWGFGPTDTRPSAATKDVHIEDNTVTGNRGGGIVFQGSDGTVSRNRITGNGAPTGYTTGLLFNAIDSRAVDNDIQNNQVFFGVDAGGTVRSVVSGNTIRNDGVDGHGNGLNIGGSFDDVINNNTIINSGRVQVHFARQEAGGTFFPWDSGAAQITGNRITTTSPAQVGLELLGAPSHLVVKDNIFDGPSPEHLVADTSVASEWRNNRYASEGGAFAVHAAERLVLPDWVETAEVTGGGAIATIVAATQAANASKVINVVMTQRGGHYTSAPTVSFRGGDCGGVVGEAKVSQDQRIAQVLITDPGRGCRTPPQVVLTGGGGEGATAMVPTLGTPVADGRRLHLRFAAPTELRPGGNLRLAPGATTAPAGGELDLQWQGGMLVETGRRF